MAELFQIVSRGPGVGESESGFRKRWLAHGKRRGAITVDVANGLFSGEIDLDSTPDQDVQAGAGTSFFVFGQIDSAQWTRWET